MNINSETNIYGLIGHPISKSLSPIIHNTSFELNNTNSKYIAFDINPSELENAIKGIKALGIKGFNVTIPFKESIIKYLDDIDDIALKIGAVNTVINNNGKLIGYNTDGLGFIQTIKNLDFNNIKILVIGAGGASRGITFYLAQYGVKEITIINRTIQNAEKLSNDLKSNFNEINIKCYDLKNNEVDYSNYELIINTTSIGMYPNVNEVPIILNDINKKCIVYDIIYKPNETKLLYDANKLGVKVINGLDMLINQALLSEEIWGYKNFVEYSHVNEIKRRIFNI